MARAARIALDLALVSIVKIRPSVSRAWGSTKSAVLKTRAKPVVCNVVVKRCEESLDKFAVSLISVLTNLRNKQLPKEEKYLEEELKKVRERIANDTSGHKTSSKAARPIFGVAWQYAKIEMAPPGTLGFFLGPGGKKFEDSVAKSVDEFIAGLGNKIKELDQAELKAKQEKEAAIKVAQEKLKAEALAQQQKRQENEKRIKAENEAKAKIEAKAKTDTKAETDTKAKTEPKAKIESRKEEKKNIEKLKKNTKKEATTDKSETKKTTGKK